MLFILLSFLSGDGLLSPESPEVNYLSPFIVPYLPCFCVDDLTECAERLLWLVMIGSFELRTFSSINESLLLVMLIFLLS